MTDNSHTKTATDGSCVDCRQEAEVRGDCSECCGRGSFDQKVEPYSFECRACRGAGTRAAQMKQRLREQRRAEVLG